MRRYSKAFTEVASRCSPAGPGAGAGTQPQEPERCAKQPQYSQPVFARQMCLLRRSGIISYIGGF